MTKLRRQEAILRIIRKQAIHTQEDLAVALREAGLPATQVTLSRDLRELGLVKTAEGYRAMAEPAPHPPPKAMISGSVTEVKSAQNLVILKTSPGHASPVAVSLDRSGWTEIVGTIAGDDTVLVVTPDTATASALNERFRAMLPRT